MSSCYRDDPASIQDSQIPNAGDYFTTTIGLQPVLMIRHEDGVVRCGFR